MSEKIEAPLAEKNASRAAWIIGEQFFRLSVGLILSIWMVRLLGPHDFGRLNYAVSISAILGVAATLGLTRILVREFVAHRDNSKWIWSLLQTAIRLRLWAALCLNIVGLVVSMTTSEHEALLVFTLTLGFFFSAFDCIDLYYQARMGTTALVKVRLMAFVPVAIARVAMLACEAPVQIFAALYLLEVACSALAIILYLRRNEAPLRLHPLQHRHMGANLIKESWPEIIAGFSGMLFMRMDQVMLQHMVGPESVGHFAAAAKLSELWYFIPNAIAAANFPALLACREVSFAQYHQRLRLLMTKLVALSYCAILGVFVVGDYAIEIIYGPGYESASRVLTIHIWCGTLVVLALMSGMWIMAEKMTIRNMFRNIFGAVINIFLNLVLIPIYGAEGAAYATLLAFLSAYFLYDFLDPGMRDMAWMKLQSLLLWDGVRWLLRRQ